MLGRPGTSLFPYALHESSFHFGQESKIDPITGLGVFRRESWQWKEREPIRVVEVIGNQSEWFKVLRNQSEWHKG